MRVLPLLMLVTLVVFFSGCISLPEATTITLPAATTLFSTTTTTTFAAALETYCGQDADCGCGTHKTTGDCFYGNKVYVDEEKQCPDFCNGIAGNLIIRCINNTCTQVRVHAATTTTSTMATAVTSTTTTTTAESTLPPQKWVVEEGVRVEEGVAPLALKLPDGRLRMYVTGMGGISSYTSSDGLKFTLEKKGVMDGVNPAVTRLADGRYRMIYNFMEGRMEGHDRKLYFKSAISADGINFMPEEGVRFRSQGPPDYDAISVPDIVELPDGRLRMYYTGDMFGPVFARDGNSVRSAVSQDHGWTWKRDEGVRLPFESMDPDVVVLPDGRYRMYYTTNPPQASKDDQRVYSAISGDGLDFTFEGEVLSSGKVGVRYMDPEVVEIPGGYRMYFSEATGGPGNERTVLKSAVWKIQ